MPTVYAAMVEFPQGAFEGVATGYDAFADAVSRADALFNQEAHSASDIRVFMAPEYFLSTIGETSSGATPIGSMSSGDKIDIYKQLRRTSAAYSDMLIVAGSAPTRTAIAARPNGLVINCDLSGMGGGNGITTVTGYTGATATVGAKNTAIIRTNPLGNGGQVTLYGSQLN